MLPFLRRKKPEVLEGKGFIPTERVKELAGRGYSEVEIIDILRKEGFSPSEVDKALTQALRAALGPKAAPTPTPTPPPPEKKEEKLLPTFEELKKETKREAAPPSLEVPEAPLEEYYPPTEEYIDALIEARISEVNENIAKLATKYREQEKKIESLSEQISQLVGKRSEEQQQILQRIENFKSSVEDLNTRIGAVERAFKETLPALIESVRALSDLVQRLKREA